MSKETNIYQTTPRLNSKIRDLFASLPFRILLRERVREQKKCGSRSVWRWQPPPVITSDKFFKRRALFGAPLYASFTHFLYLLLSASFRFIFVSFYHTFVLLNKLTTNTIYYLFFNFQDFGKNFKPWIWNSAVVQFQEMILLLTSACMLLRFSIPIVNLSVFDSGFTEFLSILCLLEPVRPNCACEGSGLHIFIDFV